MSTLDTFATGITIRRTDPGILRRGAVSGRPVPAEDLNYVLDEQIRRSNTSMGFQRTSTFGAVTLTNTVCCPANDEIDCEYLIADTAGSARIRSMVLGLGGIVARALTTETVARMKLLTPGVHVLISSGNKFAYSTDRCATLSSWSAAGICVDIWYQGATFYVLDTSGNIKSYSGLANVVSGTPVATVSTFNNAGANPESYVCGSEYRWVVSNPRTQTIKLHRAGGIVGAQRYGEISVSGRRVAFYQGKFFHHDGNNSTGNLYESFDGYVWTKVGAFPLGGQSYLDGVGSTLCLSTVDGIRSTTNLVDWDEMYPANSLGPIQDAGRRFIQIASNSISYSGIL